MSLGHICDKGPENTTELVFEEGSLNLKREDGPGTHTGREVCLSRNRGNEGRPHPELGGEGRDKGNYQ